MSSKAEFCTHFSQRSRGSWGIGLIGQRLPSRVHDPSHSFQDGVIHEQQWKSAKQGRDTSRAYSAINQWKNKTRGNCDAKNISIHDRIGKKH